MHRLLLTLPCSRASDLRPAVFVGNTSAGATARSLAMTGKVRTTSNGAAKAQVLALIRADGRGRKAAVVPYRVLYRTVCCTVPCVVPYRTVPCVEVRAPGP